MSIADKLTQLTNIRSNIRQKLTEKGVEASSHNFSDFATDIEAIETGITPTGSIEITENGTYDVSDKAEAVVDVQGGTSDVEIVKFAITVTSDITTLAEATAIFGPACEDVADNSIVNFIINTPISDISGTQVLVCWQTGISQSPLANSFGQCIRYSSGNRTFSISGNTARISVGTSFMRVVRTLI